MELSVPSPSNSPSRHSENSQALSPRDSILASPSLVSSPAGLGHCGRLLASGDASSVGPVDGVTPLPYLLLVWQISGASEALISPTPLSGGMKQSGALSHCQRTLPPFCRYESGGGLPFSAPLYWTSIQNGHSPLFCSFCHSPVYRWT